MTNSRVQRIAPLGFACRFSDLTCISCFQFKSIFCGGNFANKKQSPRILVPGRPIDQDTLYTMKFITIQCGIRFSIQSYVVFSSSSFLQLNGCHSWLTIKPTVTSESMFKIDFENSKVVNCSEHPTNDMTICLSIWISLSRCWKLIKITAFHAKSNTSNRRCQIVHSTFPNITPVAIKVHMILKRSAMLTWMCDYRELV